MTTKIRLQKTLKEGLRRCVYRRWEAEVKGKALTAKTTDLERMYRGNTPYPTRKPKVTRRAFNAAKQANEACQRLAQRRTRLGYRAA
jgi:hypothetical protein